MSQDWCSVERMTLGDRSTLSGAGSVLTTGRVGRGRYFFDGHIAFSSYSSRASCSRPILV